MNVSLPAGAALLRACRPALVLAPAIFLLSGAAPSRVAAQTGDDFIAEFLTVDGAARMLGFTGGRQKSSSFERDRRGFGIEAKQVMSRWGGMFLLGQVLDSPVYDGGAEIEVDLGIDLFLVRAGPVALSLQASAGMYNLKPDEGEAILLQYGGGAGIYLAVNRHFVLGFTGTRNQLDTVGPRSSFLLHLLVR